MTENEKKWIPVFGLICAVYIALRFWHLTDSCLWFDEVFGVHAAEHDWSSLFGFVSRDLIHPPLFYILLKIWISVFGDSLFWLRVFPVIFSVVAIIPFFLLSRQVKLSNPAIALAFSFFTVNGYLIKYAQEVRMYSLLLCLSLTSIWLFARFLSKGRGIWFLLFFNILLVYTHYFGFFVIAGEFIAVLVLRKDDIARFLLICGLTVLSFVPWIVAVIGAAQINADLSQNLGWAVRPGLTEILRFVFNLNEPFYFQASSIGSFSIFFITVPILLALIAAVVLFATNKERQTREEKNSFILLLIILTTPVLIGFVLSWILPVSIWGTRHFIVIFAPYVILAAKIVDLIQTDQLKKLIFGGVVFLFCAAFVLHLQRGSEKFIWCGWENLAAQIPVAENKKTRVFAFEDESAYLLWFAMRERSDIQVIKVEGIKGLLEDKAYFLPRAFYNVRKAGAMEMDGNSFFIAFRAEDYSDLAEPLNGLKERGFSYKEPQVFEAQGLKAFLFEIERK